MNCRRCKKEFEFNDEHRKVISGPACSMVYSPNHVCKDCRPFCRRG